MVRRRVGMVLAGVATVLCSVMANGATQSPIAGPPKLGEMAPAFTFDAIIPNGAPGGVALETLSSARLRGRVVVLDFFASWCGPCIALIPHTNKVMAETRDLPVTFVAVAYESRQTLDPVLAKFPMHVTMALDANGSSFEDFWVGALPAVAVIGTDGRLLAYTHPSQITRAVLEDAVAGRRPDVKPAPTTDVKRAWIDMNAPVAAAQQPNPSSAPMAKATIQEVERMNGMVRSNPRTGVISAPGIAVRSMLLIALGVDGRELDIRAPLDEKKFYAVEIAAADGSLVTAKALLRSLIEQTFKVRITEETVDTDVYFLTRLPGAKPLPAPPPSDRLIRRAGTYMMRDATMEDLAFELGRATDRPVVDRTNLPGRHSFDLIWDLTEGSSALRAALTGLGLGIERGRAPVKRWVVSPQ